MATWYDLTFSYGSVLTAVQLTRLDGNLDALAEGSSGAPSIQTAALANAAVTYAKLAANAVKSDRIDWSVSQYSKTVGSNDIYVLPKGLYLFQRQDYYDGEEISVQAYINGSWQDVLQYGDHLVSPGDGEQMLCLGGVVFSDGTNVRLRNNDVAASHTIYGLRLG